MKLRLPRYRVWAGFALWLGATAADAVWFRSGLLSLAGFAAAFIWFLEGAGVKLERGMFVIGPDQTGRKYLWCVTQVRTYPSGRAIAKLIHYVHGPDGGPRFSVEATIRNADKLLEDPDWTPVRWHDGALEPLRPTPFSR